MKLCCDRLFHNSWAVILVYNFSEVSQDETFCQKPYFLLHKCIVCFTDRPRPHQQMFAYVRKAVRTIPLSAFGRFYSSVWLSFENASHV